MKTALIIQPGGLGDIFLCAPIAKYYHDQGYKVVWPVREDFIIHTKGFWYSEFIPLTDNKYMGYSDWLKRCVMQCYDLHKEKKFDLVLDLADREGPQKQRLDENFEQCKYRLANVPFEEKHSLLFVRSGLRETELNKLIKPPEKYAFVHLEDSLGGRAEMPETDLPIIEIKPIKDYSIIDWYKIIEQASEIYVVESAVHQFLDGIVKLLTPKRCILPRPVLGKGKRFTVSANWNLEYVGKDSIIIG